MGSKYVMKTKGGEEYIFEMIESEEFWFIVMVPNLYEILKLGVVVKMVIKNKREFLFGDYVE
jgi:hypothetical protein